MCSPNDEPRGLKFAEQSNPNHTHRSTFEFATQNFELWSAMEPKLAGLQCWVTFECNSEALNSRSKNGMLWKQSICAENGLELSHHIPAVYSTIYCTWIGIQKMGSRETRAVESPFKNVHLFWLDLNRRMAIPLWMWPNIARRCPSWTENFISIICEMSK